MRLIRQSKGEQETSGNGGGPTWIDLDLRDPGALSWLETQLEFEDETGQLLRSAVDRNRRLACPEGLFLSLCYPSGAPDEEREEAVFHIRVLIDRNRILTIREGRIPSIEAIWPVIREDEEQITSGWNILARLAMRIAARLEIILDQAAGDIDKLEDRVFEDDQPPPIDELGELRRDLILDRRHIASMTRLFEETAEDPALGLGENEVAEMRGVVQSMARLDRTVEFFLERANLIQEQIQSLLSDRMNTATLRLGVVATVFLPLSFLTGLLGINVAGMPGSHNPIAFWVVCALLTILALGAWVLVANFHTQNISRSRSRSRDEKPPKSGQ